MKLFLILSATLNVVFLIMHELDACYTGEWKMFKFLRAFKERNQYLIFLYFHIPLFGFFIYYLWSVYNFNNFILWITVNSFGIIHLFIHLAALKWKSNVFKSFTSFFLIGGAALTGAINLFLLSNY